MCTIVFAVERFAWLREHISSGCSVTVECFDSSSYDLDNTICISTAASGLEHYLILSYQMVEACSFAEAASC